MAWTEHTRFMLNSALTGTRSATVPMRPAALYSLAFPDRRELQMLRISRSLAVMAALILLAACGNKGDLVKPSAPPADKAATADRG